MGTGSRGCSFPFLPEEPARSLQPAASDCGYLQLPEWLLVSNFLQAARMCVKLRVRMCLKASVTAALGLSQLGVCHTAAWANPPPPPCPLPISSGTHL